MLRVIDLTPDPKGKPGSSYVLINLDAVDCLESRGERQIVTLRHGRELEVGDKDVDEIIRQLGGTGG